MLAVSLLIAPARAAQDDAVPAPLVTELVGAKAWESYFPFRLGDSWTYDWRATGPLAPGGVAVRTRTFDGTSFLGNTVGYKLVSDDGAYHLYTFENGVLAIHSSSEAGRLFYYDPPLVLAAPDMRVGESRVVTQAEDGRRWTTTLVGVEQVDVPLGQFARALTIRVDMDGPDFTSSATHYFAPKVGLVAYRYALRDGPSGKPLLDIEANLRLARLGGARVTTADDLGSLVAPRADDVSEDRGLRESLKRALEKRYTWDAGFPGFTGDAEYAEPGKAPLKASFVVGPDLSVKVDAKDAATRAALVNEISSFVTQRKATPFDLTYAETTFVKAGTRADGAIIVRASGDPLAATYALKGDQVVEVGRSLGRVSYTARDRASLATGDGRTIASEYDVVFTSNADGGQISAERITDRYAKVGGYWLPLERRVERTTGNELVVARVLRLTDVRVK